MARCRLIYTLPGYGYIRASLKFINEQRSYKAQAAGPSGAELLEEVQKLAGEGYRKGEIAERLGFRNLSTLSGRLVQASQQSGQPVPVFGGRFRVGPRRMVESVEVRPRGRGPAFGVNIPQEPLERLGAKPGDTLSVSVSHGRIMLAVKTEEQEAREPAGPRLVKDCERR